MNVKLTRRQWLELPLDQKTRVGAAPAVIVVNPKDATVHEIPVQWVGRPEDSDLKMGVDTTANEQ